MFKEDLRGEIMVPAAKKLEDLIHLAELCVDLLQQNEEHYAELRKHEKKNKEKKEGQATKEETTEAATLGGAGQGTNGPGASAAASIGSNDGDSGKSAPEAGATGADGATAFRYCMPTHAVFTSPVPTAFAWFSDLLVEHAEIFWSLFAVDMDRVLTEQPPDTWDSFPLFQILNDYLRVDDNLRNGRFHQHLRDTFAPLVVRYVDLMESSIAQSIHKGFEKERWDSKGNGCATSEDLFWKLDALQSFIRDLHWPDAEFRQHLEQRLKMMATEMIEQCIQRTDSSFQSWLKKNVAFISTDYIIPSEMCAMVNVILDAKNQSFKLTTIDGIDLYKFHAKIDDQIDKANVAMTQGLISKLMSVLESTLSKLARYDEGSLIGSILSFTNVSSSGKDLGQGYVNFFRNNMDQIRGKIGDDLWTLNFFEQWYTQQINMLCNWLSERLDHALHYAQVTSISHITKKIYSDFELQGVLEDKLNSKAYQTVAQRMATEEATCALTMPDVVESDENVDGLKGEGGDEDVAGDDVGGGASRGLPKPKIAAAQAAAVTNVVAGRVGNLLGKGIGGLSSKLGGGSWF
ncbi:calcium-dependent secretion activator-like isoform X2 [Bactrocera tryoni]|uniref:calcium-dependent secretion activator-like isoform X2 n=1 Tax=Bactrocera tryoni TaxID=59916 RepID=UPI001A9631F3|nr:calcium-dependent secretion activator-like isoform X2 [Bactrocera tryoni]